MVVVTEIAQENFKKRYLPFLKRHSIMIIVDKIAGEVEEKIRVAEVLEDVETPAKVVKLTITLRISENA